MANIVVNEFVKAPDTLGNLHWPANRVTRLASPCTIVTSPSTNAVLITCDADTRMTNDGAAPTAADTPVMSVVPNLMVFTGAVPRTLKFL